jgi:hypothetical protein
LIVVIHHVASVVQIAVRIPQVINTTEVFRTRLAESAEASSQLANNFMRISLQPDEVNEPWTALAKKQSELLRTMAGSFLALINHFNDRHCTT